MANILIVEDDRLIATVASAIVKKAGHKVVSVARTSTDAVRLATVHRPDLVLMDIGLEGSGDGIEAAAHIVDDLNVPVIFLTGHNDLVTLERAQQVNPLGFLSKPVREADVINTITIALNQRKQQQASAPDPSEATFNGRIDMLGGIASVLEMVKVIHSQCALRFEDGAVLYVAEGKIIHAKLADLTPDEAAKQLLSRNEGMFRLDPDSEPEAGRSLALDITTVLLNLAKQADEAHKDILEPTDGSSENVSGAEAASSETLGAEAAQPDLASHTASLTTSTSTPDVPLSPNKPTTDDTTADAEPAQHASSTSATSSIPEPIPEPTPEATPEASEARLAGFLFIGKVSLDRDMGKPLVIGQGVVHLPEKRYLSEFKATLLPVSYEGWAQNAQGRHNVKANVRLVDMTEGSEP
ncbi:MAG: response regulator, partial [Deinococcota bacterium]